MEEFIEQDLSNRCVNADLMGLGLTYNLEFSLPGQSLPRWPSTCCPPSGPSSSAATHKHRYCRVFTARSTLVHRSPARACRHLGGEVPVEEALAVQVPESPADVQR